MRNLATVRTVDEVRPIEGADRIELATFAGIGWSCVVKKGEVEPGERVVYFEIDSFLPTDDARYDFLAKGSRTRSELLGEGYRIRSQRFRGQLSQGLALPLSLFPEISSAKDGEDVTEALRVRKWEIPEAASDMGTVTGDMPGDIPRTDETRIQSMPSLLDSIYGRPYYISQKIDGTSATIYRLAGRKGVCGHRREFADDGKSVIWDFVKRKRVFEVLDQLNLDLVIQGEWAGPKVQGNRLRLKKGDLFVFNVLTPSMEPVEVGRATKIAAQLGLSFVPILETGDFFDYTLEGLKERAKGTYASGLRQEGIVVRPKSAVFEPALGRFLSFKVLNDDFLLKDER